MNDNDPRDPDTGPNALQNYPLLSRITLSGGTRMLEGTLNTTRNITFTLEVFYDPDPLSTDEGQVYVGFLKVRTDANGNAAISYPLPVSVPAEVFVTATSTGPAKNTSEFSPALWVDE